MATLRIIILTINTHSQSQTRHSSTRISFITTDSPTHYRHSHLREHSSTHTQQPLHQQTRHSSTKTT